MNEYTRRRLVGIGGAVAVSAVAGCTGGEQSADAGATGDGPVLETISLENLDDSDHTVDVILRWSDEIDYWTTHELDAIGDGDGGSLTLSDGWQTEPGEFLLTVRLDDDSRARFSSTQLPDRECLNLLVMVSRDAELSILTDVSGGRCETDENESDTDE